MIDTIEEIEKSFERLHGRYAADVHECRWLTAQLATQSDDASRLRARIDQLTGPMDTYDKWVLALAVVSIFVLGVGAGCLL